MAFNKAFDHLMKAEGGYANNKHDRGGETFYGVSTKYFPKEVGEIKRLVQSGEDPTKYVRDFYKREFWDKSGAESIADPSLQLAYFDTAVNSGIGKAKELLNASTDTNDFLNRRQGFVNQIIENDPSQAEFKNGWKNRIDSLRGEQMPYTREEIMAELERRKSQNKEAQSPEPTHTRDEILAELERRGALPSKVESGVMGATQGATFGFADEMGSYAQGLFEGIKNLSVEDGINKYHESMKNAQDDIQLAQDTNPGSYLTGEIAGGLAGFGGAAKVAPKAVKGISDFARRGKIATGAAAAGTGGVSGGIYGAGTGSGDLGERAEQALGMAGLGAAGGVSGAFLGGAGARGLSALNKKLSLSERVARLIGKPSTTNTLKTQMNELLPAEEARKMQTGEVLRLTKGQASQDPRLQALENRARSGTISDEAQSLALAKDYATQDDILAVLSRVNGEADDDALTKAANIVKQSYKKTKADVSKAYDNAEVIKSVVVDKKPIVEGFVPKMKDVMYKQGFDASSITPESKRVLDQVLDGPLKDSKITGMNLEKMEFWRRKLSNRANQMKGDPEGVMLGRILNEYDTFMAKLPQEALKTGNEDALAAINKARSLRRRQGVLFERDKVVQKMVTNDELTNEELANMVLAGTAKGKNANASTGRVVKNLKRAVGEGQAEELTQSIKKGTLARILDKAEQRTQRAGQDVNMISPAKLETELSNLLKNKTFMREVYSPEEQKLLTALRNDIKKIASDQPGSKNYSNTAYTIMQFFQDLPLGLSSVSAVSDAVLKPLGNRSAKKELKGALDPYLNKIREELTGTAKIYGASAGGIASSGE